MRIEIPFRLRVEKTLDDPGLQTLLYGPVNLVVRDPGRDYLRLGLYGNAALSGDLLPSLTPVKDKPLHFTLGDSAGRGVEIAPFFEGTEDPTHVYFRREEPAVVLGGDDSGVANPAKPDGTTLLDEIWAAAPFNGKGLLLQHVKATVDAWVTAGLLSEAGGRKVVDTAKRAHYEK
ncbi:hypothetical protein ACQP2K_24905 [Microbispora siamensis]